MFKKEINNAPLTSLGGKGGYYRKLLIVFVLIFTLIVPFSVSAYTTSNLNISVNPDEVRPNFHMLNFGDGNAFESSSFIFGVDYTQLAQSNPFRSDLSYPDVSIANKQYWLSFIMPDIPMRNGEVYKLVVPVAIQGGYLENVKIKSAVLEMGRQFDGDTYSTNNYVSLNATIEQKKTYDINGNKLFCNYLIFEVIGNTSIHENHCTLKLTFSSGTGTWRWFSFYDTIQFEHTDKSADQITNAITNQGNQIVNGMQQQAEQEKNEINSSGNSNLDGLTSAVPDYSSGFVTALTKLGNSMGYNGRNSVWTIPSIYIPEIQGVIPRTKLIDTQQIDFSNMFNKMPENIIIFIRSLTTILLIVYCGKELYSLFSFIFNSGKGKND